MTVRYSPGQLNSLLAKIKLDQTLCFVDIYSGAQPASSANPQTGTLLATVTLEGDGVTGLTFDDPVGAVMGIPSGVNWQATGLADGTAGSFRLRTAIDTNVQSETELRIDGAVGTSSGDMILSNVQIKTGAPLTIDVFNITLR